MSKVVVGTAMISTLEKRNIDCMTEKLNIFKVSQVPAIHLLSLTASKDRFDTHCKIKETLLIQELRPTLNDTVSIEKLYLY